MSTDAVTAYRADNGRLVALVVRSDFEAYGDYPPYLSTDAEREHLATAYDVEDAETERNSKAHLTGDDLPLQVILLNRPAGSITKPHYHENTEPAESATRHQIMICQRGAADIGIYTVDGEHLDTVTLKGGDLILLAEGHSIRMNEPDTKLLEIKQGPFPGTDDDDKVELPEA